MKRMIMACLVVCTTACGSSGSGSSEPEEGASTTGAEDGDEHRVAGRTEHDCELRQQRECADLACHWVADPDAAPAATAATETSGEDTSLRDDVTIGPRSAATEGEGQLCVHAGDEPTDCPEICCTVCPRE